MGRRKPRLTLPPGDSGEFILTPAIARHTHSVVSDLERLVRKRSISLGVDLWFQLTVVSTGMKVTWGPGSEVIVEDNDTDETGQEVTPEQDDVVTDSLWDYLNEKYDELNPNPEEDPDEREAGTSSETAS